MIHVLIGHRGVGKTALLQRLKNYFSNSLFFDLDQEIERELGLAVSQIFHQKGEGFFRKLELEIFNKISNKVAQDSEVWISLGAGFELQYLNNTVDKIWIRRKTDNLPRIFSNRPRLSSEGSAGEEYLRYYQQRELIFHKYYDRQYLMPEGVFTENEIERLIFSNNYSASKAILTLNKKNLYLVNSGFEYLEIRDDLFSESEIDKILPLIKTNKLIYSHRNKAIKSQIPAEATFFDWPLEISANSESSILSLHDRKTSLSESLNYLESSAKSHQHLKLAIEIESIQEIFEGIRWQAEAPQQRSFLPRSKIGQWNWVRLFLKFKQKLNFVRVDDGSSLDQPTLFEWLQVPSEFNKFSAILGQPVTHSYSPQFHSEFFKKMNMPFFAIDVDESNFKENLSFLTLIGLHAAAVTSPLKELAFQEAVTFSEQSKKFCSANTLLKIKKGWFCDNTDIIGFKALIKNYQESSIAVWGGGGTLAVIRELLPQAQFLSVRTGADRHGRMSIVPADTLVWAASPAAQLPPDELRPKTVLDLNYREDSRAKEFAIKVGAEYISGYQMFLQQALAQQLIWKDL